MFTTNHFILLGFCLLIIIGYMHIQKKFNISYRTNLIALFCVGIVCEMLKLMVNMEVHPNDVFDTSGAYLTQESLPFHLCSIQNFFVLFLLFFIKRETTKQVLLEFMFPSMCVGASIALFIPTAGVDFKNPQIYEYFIFHTYIIAFAINLVRSKTITITWKTLIRNIGILFGLCIMDLYINSILQDHNTNFMFVTRPPMDNLPILNLNQGWHMYFMKLIIVSVTAITLFHIPFILIENKRKRLLNN